MSPHLPEVRVHADNDMQDPTAVGLAMHAASMLCSPKQVSNKTSGQCLFIPCSDAQSFMSGLMQGMKGLGSLVQASPEQVSGAPCAP